MSHGVRFRRSSLVASGPAYSLVCDDFGASHVIRIIGEADLSTVPDLEAALERAAAEAESIVLDLSACRYFDSSVIEILVRAAKRWNDRFTIVIPSDSRLRRILAMCDLDDVLPVRHSAWQSSPA